MFFWGRPVDILVLVHFCLIFAVSASRALGIKASLTSGRSTLLARCVAARLSLGLCACRCEVGVKGWKRFLVRLVLVLAIVFLDSLIDLGPALTRLSLSRSLSASKPQPPLQPHSTHLESQSREEPPILPAHIPLLQHLLDRLLRLLPLADLLERVVRHHAFQALEFQRVPRRHDVVVVDELDERFYLAALLGAFLAHPLGHFERVAVDAGDEGVGEWVGFGAGVEGGDYYDLRLMGNVRVVDELGGFFKRWEEGGGWAGEMLGFGCRGGLYRTFLPA